MDEKQLKTISVIGAILSLVAVYLFVSLISPEFINICDITLEHTGKIINVTGKAKNIFHNNGNVFFTLVEDQCEIRVVLWKDIVSGMELRGVNISLLEENMTVNLAGEVDVHQGYLQIVPTRPEVKMVS
jgi:exonuclease VII large subunit